MPSPRHVYVHVPFCARRCSYCDFSIAVRREVPVDDYLRALDAELSLRFPDVDRPELEDPTDGWPFQDPVETGTPEIDQPGYATPWS